MTPPLNKLIVGLILYISTGIAQPILVDTLRIHALLGHKYLLLPTLANTTGMALCGLVASTVQWSEFKTLLFASSSDVKNGGRNLKRLILMTSLLDLISGMCLTFGILMTGGAIFVILYNSCPAWTAILSRFLLGKKLGTVQMLGVVLVCIGLVTNVLGTKMTLGASGDGEGKDNSAYMGVIFGSVIVLLGSLFHSLMFVVSDWALSSFSCHDHNTTVIRDEKKTNISISGEIWSCCLGTIEATFMLLWVMIGIIISGFQEQGYVPPSAISTDGESSYMNSIDGNLSYVIGGFILLVIVDAVHAAAFFTLLKDIGAVASALLKGLQMVVVIALSAFFFCAKESSQCLTPSKALSALFVLSGVVCYGLGGGGGKKEEKKDTSPTLGTGTKSGKIASTLEDQDSVEVKPLIK